MQGQQVDSSRDVSENHDLLDFSQKPREVMHTPGVHRETRASWVAEMNAELAEFDALTSGSVVNEHAGPVDEGRWRQSLEQELADHLR